MRGWLNDEHGVKLKDVHWYQAGTNEAGRTEKVELSLPEGRQAHPRSTTRSLSDMLAKGEIDCALVARPPDCFMQGHPGRGAAVPGLPGDGGEVLRAHQGVADHARDRDQEVDPRRESRGSPAASTTRSIDPRTAALARMVDAVACRAIRCRG